MFEVYAQDYRITIQEIPLGNQGEDMARCLVIDITDAVNEFGSGGTVSVRNKRNGDELPYFCTNVSTVTGADAEGNVHTYIKWTLTDVDTAVAGSGFVQADYIISGTTVKTWVYKYFILPSLGITGDVPDPYEDILEEIEAQVSAVQTAAASAAASAAQASAEATRIISTTQQVVENWLSDHIVTGYTVDDTLTISGAAADSATVGTQLRAAFVTETTSGSIASFADGADGVPLKDLVVNITPKQAGTGDPSPSNVRAISGWTEANISVAGKNLFPVPSSLPANVTYQDGYYAVNFTTGSSGEERVLFGGWNISSAVSFGLSSGTYIWSSIIESVNGGSTPRIFVRVSVHGTEAYEVWNANTARTINADDKFFVLFFCPGASTTFNATVKLQLEPGATATEFVPYNPNSTQYNVSFGSSAGTVYGGTLDVTTGMLTVTHKLAKMNSYTWGMVGGVNPKTFYCNGINDMVTGLEAGDVWCSKYKYNGVVATDRNTNLCIAREYVSRRSMIVSDNSYTSAADFNASLTDADIMVYPIAQPVSYQLTPTEVKSLLANNNIWSDTGSVASCEYRADTKLYLEKLTNPDDDMVANANITSGSYFMVGNNLYLATAAIASGASIVPGTNCTLTNLASALNAINS